MPANGKKCTCAYFGCLNKRKSKNNELSFFKFPVSKSALLKQWVKNCGNRDISLLDEDYLKNSYICENHFEKTYIYVSGGRRRLQQTAIPIFWKELPSDRKQSQEDPSTSQDTQTEYQDNSSCSSSHQAIIDDAIKMEDDDEFKEVNVKVEPLDETASATIAENSSDDAIDIPFACVKDETAETEGRKIKLMLEKEEDSDEDLLFFKSLLPDFKLLPRTSKMALRIKFQQLIYDETLSVSANVSS